MTLHLDVIPPPTPTQWNNVEGLMLFFPSCSVSWAGSFSVGGALAVWRYRDPRVQLKRHALGIIAVRVLQG